MKHRYHKLHCISLFFSFLSPVFAGETFPEILTVYTEQSFPVSYTENDAHGIKVLGYGTELVKAVLEYSDIDYKIETVPWIRAVQAIDTQENVLVYAMTRTNEREDKYHWIGEIAPIEYRLFGLRKNITQLPASLEQAKSLRIGVVREDVTKDYLQSQGFLNLVSVNDPERNLAMLQRGRIDLFPFSANSISLFLEKNNFDPRDLVSTISLDEISTGLYMVLGKHSSPEMVEKLRNSYRAIVENGTYNRIVKPNLTEGIFSQPE